MAMVMTKRVIQKGQDWKNRQERIPIDLILCVHSVASYPSVVQGGKKVHETSTSADELDKGGEG